MVELSDISDSCIPFVRCCGVEQEVMSDKTWEAKGAESCPSVTTTSLPLRATSHYQQRPFKLWESVDHESQGGEQGPAWGQKVGYGGEEEEEEEGGFVERIVVAHIHLQT